MTLTASGTIQMSQINTELGRGSTDTISLDDAENGTYAAINSGASPKPSATNPAAMSEWYSYNHAFSNFSNFGNFGSFGNFVNCFWEETLVGMADGTEKQMKDVITGEKINTINIPSMPDENEASWYEFTTNELSGSSLSTTSVLHKKTGTEASYYFINNLVKVTHEHRFFIKRNGTWSWIHAENIIVGDMYLNANIQELAITSIIQVNEPLTVVSFNTETNDTYIAGDMYNHNPGKYT